MIATSPQSRQILGVNQQSYQALRASMSLDLRRQLLIAVCDNVVMQNHLAEQLELDLAQGEKALALTRLMFDPEDGNLPQQVAQWVRQTMLSEGGVPKIQMVGIEQMTRQPAITQNYFLRSLEKIEALLPRLNTSLLIWVPWPWLRTIQQSSPTFWSWRNGVYEFISDPTPASAEPEPLSPAFPPAESVAQSNRQNNGYQNGHQNGQNHQNGHANGHQNGCTILSNKASDVSAVLYGEGTNGRTADGPLATSGTVSQPELEPAESLTETLPGTEQIPLELLDDDLGDDALRQAAFSSDTTSAAQLPASAPKGLASLGGLRSIVSQGVNVTQALDEDNAALFDAILSDPEDLPEEAFLDEDMDAAEQVAAEFASLNWDDFSSESVSVEAVASAALEKPQNEQHKIEKTETELSPSVVTQVVVESSFPGNRVPLPEPPLPGPLPEPVIPGEPAGEAVSTLVSTPDSSAESSPTSAPTVLKVGDRRELRAQNAQSVGKDVQSSAKLAAEYFATGLAYRSRIEAGDRGLDMIDPAIIAYESGLKHLANPHPDRVTALNDLGTLYWLKAQQQSDQAQAAQYMYQSVQLYQEALVASDRHSSEAAAQPIRGIVGQLYSNMGAVYTMLATCENPLENLAHAARTYQKALPLISLVSDPEEYATLQNSLGSVFWKLSHYESAENYLHQAISAYNEALLGYKPEQQPLDYAAVQNNLGITYWSLAKHERPEFLLKHAIAAYRDALNYRTSEVDPAACAISYNNLALAYWDLSKHTYTDFAQKSRYQKNAITAFEAALNISKLSGALSQMDGAAIYHCLGDVHAQMVETAASRNEIADSLQKSLYSYIQATEGLPTDSPAYPGRFGAIVANLRLHYDKLGLEGQQTALNRVPASLLPQVMMTL